MRGRPHHASSFWHAAIEEAAQAVRRARLEFRARGGATPAAWDALQHARSREAAVLDLAERWAARYGLDDEFAPGAEKSCNTGRVVGLNR